MSGTKARLPSLNQSPNKSPNRNRSRRRRRAARRRTRRPPAPANRRGRRRRSDAARPVRRLGRLHGEQRRAAALLRDRQAELAGDAAGGPAARSGLCFHLDAADRERAQRGLDHRRLSVQAGLRGHGGYRLDEIRDVHAERRRLGEEPGRRSPHGRRDAQGLRPRGQRRIRQGHEIDRPLRAARARARRSTASRRSANRVAFRGRSAPHAD